MSTGKIYPSWKISFSSKTKTLKPCAGSSDGLEGSTQPETRIRGCRFRLWQRQTSSECATSCITALVFHAQSSGLISRLRAFVLFWCRLRWRRPTKTPPPCLLWIQRIGPRTLKPLTSTLWDSEATRNPRSAMSFARNSFRRWQRMTPRLVQSGVCISLMMTRCARGAPSFYLGR